MKLATELEVKTVEKNPQILILTYHYAMRKIKMLKSNIRARKLMEASESGSGQLLKGKKKVKGSKNDLLESIGGVSG